MSQDVTGVFLCCSGSLAEGRNLEALQLTSLLLAQNPDNESALEGGSGGNVARADEWQCILPRNSSLEILSVQVETS